MGLKEELLAAIDAAAAEKPRSVTVRGFPTFYVRYRNVGEVDEQRTASDDWVKEHNLTAAAALVICDEEGKMLFDANNPEDMLAVKKFAKVPWEKVQVILNTLREDKDSDSEGNSVSARS